MTTINRFSDMSIQLLIYFHTIVLVMSIPSNVQINGLIEGFYWPNANAVQGQFNYYTKEQRDALISTMDDTLKYYFYCPQDLENDPFTMELWDSQQIADWSDTVLNASRISIVMGLRPRWIDNVQSSLEIIKSKLNQLASIGVRYYILSWDDAPGAGTTSQMELQRDLIHALVLEVKNIELIGVIPAYYSLSQISEPTNIAWANQLSILNQISSHIRFFVTGSQVVPSALETSDVPTLKNRQFIFFDNWIAVDSNSRVTMSWPPNRDPMIYRTSETNSGSVLNLAYPPERIIHQIYAAKKRIDNKYLDINSYSAAAYWATYLITNHFYPVDSYEQLKSNLQSAIDDGYETNDEIIQHYPLLDAIFRN